MSKQNFQWDKYDLITAISCFVLGFLYMRMVFFSQEGWGVTLFTLFFLCSVFAYARIKHIKHSNESLFWAGVLMVISVSFALWEGHNLTGLRLLLLLVAAIYWVLILTRTTQNGSTSDWLPFDVLKGMIIGPIAHLNIQYSCIYFFSKGKVHLRSKLIFGILGVLIAGIFILIAWPLLIRADAGGFQDLLHSLNLYPLEFPQIDNELVIQIILMFPVAAYMFALLAKGAHKPSYEQNSDFFRKMPEKIRILPELTVHTALIILIVFYVVFFITQAPYYSSAFRGLIPEGWDSYADFARRGFFELISILFLNLIFIAFSYMVIAGTSKKALPFKLLISMLSVSSIFLTITATARLVLYVDRFGLTFMRVLPAVFMVFLTILLIGIIVKQFKQITVMRLGAFSGAILICLLFIVNVDGVIAGYNANRFIEGTLEEFDTVVLWEARAAGIPAAIRVLKETDDPLLEHEIRRYLQEATWMLDRTKGTIRDTLQHELSRRLLREHRELIELTKD
ncbi:MAG: hypothetical protein DDT40_01046 [candidate division WS2 bacterium]|nr:hypothetical protein [Candidatus Psychracetigena formicireducens]